MALGYEGSLPLDCAARGALGHSTERSGRARWPGRHRAEGLEGVKLIALIPLHVYHLDPGNYHAQSLNSHLQANAHGWKQMGAEQEQDGKSWVSLGEIPGTQ